MWYKKLSKQSPSRLDGKPIPEDWTPVPRNPSPRFKRELIEKRYCQFAETDPNPPKRGKKEAE
jgi:hypothetical protein